jgi:hypothetical protein
MSDLVKRLQILALATAELGAYTESKSIVQAADAIERLTAERDRLAADLAEARVLVTRLRRIDRHIGYQSRCDAFLSRTEGK